MNVGGWIGDLRIALRGLSRRPVFTTVVTSILAVGIGATTGVYAVLEGVLLDAPPFEEPDELVIVWNRLGGPEGERMPNAGPALTDYRQMSRTFESFSGVTSQRVSLAGLAGPARMVTAGYLSTNGFQLLGVDASLGRTFVPEDADAAVPGTATGGSGGAVPTGSVVLSHGFWLRAFAGDPGVLGTTVQLNGQPSVVVGVLPPDFELRLPSESGVPVDVDIWGPITGDIDRLSREAHWLPIVGRLQDGVSLDGARDDMARVSRELRTVHPYHERADIVVEVASLQEDATRAARPVVFALLGAACLVLLIACSNVANLLLLRTSARVKELALRRAMGSGLAGIARSAAAEGIVLCGIGGMLALPVGWVSVSALAAFDGLSSLAVTPTLDPSVLVFGAVTVSAVAFLLTLASVLHVGSLDPASFLREGGRKTESGGSKTVRSVLVVGQVALSLVLLVGATLFFRSLQNLSDVEPGFDATGLVAFTVSPPYTAYGTREAQTGFHDQLMGRMQTSGTVRRVGAVSRVPLAEGSERGPWALDPGDEQALDENRAEYQVVLPGYFQTMEIPLLSGRYLDERDQDYSDPTVVIDELLAERIWPGQDAVGRTLAVQRYRPDHRGFQVVPARVAGVVQSVRVGGLESPPRETIYVPLVQRARPTMTYTVQSGLPTARFEEEIRDLVASVDPSVPVHEVRTVDSYAADALSKTRALLGLGATLSGLAVLLSAMGIFGLVSHAVRGRAHELGIRLALGAEGPGLVRRAVGESLALVAGGLLVGLLATLGLTPLLESQLFGVPARDLGATLAGSAVLLVCALVSSWIPARRISGIDPAEILTRS